MTPPVFLVDAADLRADRVTLAGAEGRHAAAVRRLGVGERVDLSDGAGTLAECTVLAARRDELDLAVAVRRVVAASEPRLVVVQALAKGDRGELAVELLTEVGADEIVPWAADRSVARWSGERGEKALARWRSTAREAAKQSRRAWLPDIPVMAGTDEVCDRLRGAALAIVLHGAATAPLAGVRLPTAGEVVLVVGPEGGVSEAELAAFAAAGARSLRLGRTVLRTSSAGVVAASVLLAGGPAWR
ncbi:MAG: 16S rRNA (uracil(1498)-N(3))-methyltransferase [Actinomycetota bacterium]|nr:16S rRNA (uracil(1498)-N(3))-methyltransferase [Actinomycetota bacterium]